MADPNNTVILKVNGKNHAGWKEVEITRSIETISGSFRVGLTHKSPGVALPVGIKEGDACEVFIGSDRVVKGFVDTIEASIDASSHQYSVSGRDASGDLVDCSATHQPGQWKNLKLEAIAKSLAQPFGIQVEATTDTGEKFKDFQIEQGETVYEAIARMCKLRGVLCISDTAGHLKIIRAGSGSTATRLEEGENILSASSSFDSKDQFSEITVKGQSAGSNHAHGKHTNQAKSTVKSKAIARHRPRLILAEGQADTAKCKKRAEWEETTKRAKAKKVTVTVQGWRQAHEGKGRLWELNELTPVKSPSIFINEKLLIIGLKYKLDSGGSTTEIELADPNAYKAEPKWKNL